jgi:hypothetical protein
MRYIFFIAAIFMVLSCQEHDKDITRTKIREIKFYDELDNLYGVKKVINDSFLVDTIWYFNDSLERELKLINIVVDINGKSQFNQQISYFLDGRIDSSNSLFYSMQLKDNVLKLDYHTDFQDSVILIVGDLDENYNPQMATDTFYLDNSYFEFPYKKGYKKGKLLMLKRVDSNIYHSMDMYIKDISSLD